MEKQTEIKGEKERAIVMSREPKTYTIPFYVFKN